MESSILVCIIYTIKHKHRWTVHVLFTDEVVCDYRFYGSTLPMLVFIYCLHLLFLSFCCVVID